MDQNEGGTLIVNPRNAPEDANAGDDERNLNIVDGLPQGWKKAEVRRIALQLADRVRS